MKLPFQWSETWRFTWGFGDSSLMSLLNKNHLVKGSMVSNVSWAPYEKCVPFVSCCIDPLTTVPPSLEVPPNSVTLSARIWVSTKPGFCRGLPSYLCMLTKEMARHEIKTSQK